MYRGGKEVQRAPRGVIASIWFVEIVNKKKVKIFSLSSGTKKAKIWLERTVRIGQHRICTSDGCRYREVTSETTRWVRGELNTTGAGTKWNAATALQSPNVTMHQTCFGWDALGSKSSETLKILSESLCYKHISVFTWGITRWAALPSIYILHWVFSILCIVPLQQEASVCPNIYLGVITWASEHLFFFKQPTLRRSSFVPDHEEHLH